MNADYVENIIRNIDKQSYKCILVDGAWGIGKSYMVRKALAENCTYHTTGIENNHYHLDADECRTYFLFRFRTVLSGTNEQRTVDRCD